MLENISRDGAFIRIEDFPADFNTVLEPQLTPSGQTNLSVPAIVVWRSDRGIGLEFVGDEATTSRFCLAALIEGGSPAALGTSGNGNG